MIRTLSRRQFWKLLVHYFRFGVLLEGHVVYSLGFFIAFGSELVSVTSLGCKFYGPSNITTFSTLSSNHSDHIPRILVRRECNR